MTLGSESSRDAAKDSELKRELPSVPTREVHSESEAFVQDEHTVLVPLQMEQNI